MAFEKSPSTTLMARRHCRHGWQTEPDDTLLFTREKGGPIDRSRLYRVVRTAGRRAGIEWTVGLHTLRHTAASIMWRRGVNREQIRRVLGHHSWDFTAFTYVHLGEHDIPDGSILGDLVAVSHCLNLNEKMCTPSMLGAATATTSEGVGSHE